MSTFKEKRVLYFKIKAADKTQNTTVQAITTKLLPLIKLSRRITDDFLVSVKRGKSLPEVTSSAVEFKKFKLYIKYTCFIK